MLRNFMSTEMMPLKDLVVPMVWVYAEEVYHFMPTYNWDRFSEVFPTAWTASAYKGQYLSTLSYRIIVQQILLIFCKIPTCMPLFHPARLFILGNFEPKPYLH